jgi:hypothetical protein
MIIIRIISFMMINNSRIKIVLPHKIVKIVYKNKINKYKIERIKMIAKKMKINQ